MGFDPLDGRMMHFGDDAGEPQVRMGHHFDAPDLGWDHICYMCYICYIYTYSHGIWDVYIAHNMRSHSGE